MSHRAEIIPQRRAEWGIVRPSSARDVVLEKHMKRAILFCVSAALLVTAGVSVAGDASPHSGLKGAGGSAQPCQPVEDIRFICDVISPEDLAVVPDSDWVIASGNQEGGRIQLVSVSRKTARVLFPSATSSVRHDHEEYPACPGPLADEGNAFRAHGLYLKSGMERVHTLYVVHHGGRESVEVFELDARYAEPALTWIGCAVGQEGAVLNGVVALPDGGLAATVTNANGANADAVYEWHAKTGWTKVPGSETSSPNGLEISADGKWFYVAGWPDERFIRVSRGVTPFKRDVLHLGFRPDNLRLAPNGLIYAAGHTDIQQPTERFNVARINPATLAFERILQLPAIPGFAASTTAVPIGNDIWLGTNRGRMIGYFRAPRLNRIIEQFEKGDPAMENEHWQIISLEHSPFMVDEVEQLLKDLEAEGTGRPRLSAVVRIPYEADQDFRHVVKQFLDAGVMGIVLPQVQTPEQVARLVEAMRYPPQRGAKYPKPRGRRGWGPTGAMRLWGLTADEYARKADLWPLNPEGELLAIAMIETLESIKNIDEILEVPGLGGVIIGPSDLSLSLGVGTPGANPSAPEVEAAIKTVGNACKRHNALCGIYTRPDVERRVPQGFKLFVP